MYTLSSKKNSGLLLVPYKKSNVSVYRLCLNSLISLRSFSTVPHDSWSKFKFKSWPPDHYHWYITGKEAVNFVTFRDKLEEALGCFASDKRKICLVFGVVDIIPFDTLDARRDQGKYFGFIEIFSLLKIGLKQMLTGISYHEEGIEFIFGSEADYQLFKMINHVIGFKGKDPEMIHIWMSFWLSNDNDGHNDNDDDDELDEDHYDGHKEEHAWHASHVTSKKEYPFFVFANHSKFCGVSRRSYSSSHCISEGGELYDAFSVPIPSSYVRDKGRPFVVIFSINDLDSQARFINKIENFLPINTSYNVFIKLRYFSNNFCMAGSQFGFNYNCPGQIVWLFDIVKSRIANTFDVYNMSNDDIVYIQISFRKLDVKLLSDFTLDKTLDVINNMTKTEMETISDTSNMPVSTDESSLGTNLKITFVDNLITCIYVTMGNETFNFLDRIKAQSKLLPNGHKYKITNFDSSFKFYLIYVNTKYYILAIKYVDNNKVVKISYFLNGVLYKSIIDTLLSDNTVSRVQGNTEFFIENSIVVYSKQAVMIRPISKPKLTFLPRDNPNIGVIDLETFKDSDDTSKVFAVGFKPI